MTVPVQKESKIVRMSETELTETVAALEVARATFGNCLSWEWDEAEEKLRPMINMDELEARKEVG
jgi:hypothetical protein